MNAELDHLPDDAPLDEFHQRASFRLSSRVIRFLDPKTMGDLRNFTAGQVSRVPDVGRKALAEFVRLVGGQSAVVEPGAHPLWAEHRSVQEFQQERAAYHAKKRAMRAEEARLARAMRACHGRAEAAQRYERAWLEQAVQSS